MKHNTLRLALILGAVVLLFFGLGRFFDSRCVGSSCIAETFESLAAENGGNFDFHFDDHDDKDQVIDDLMGEVDSEGGDVNAELPATEDVDSIEIRSVSTDWKVNSVPSKLALRFHDVRLKKWTISKDGKKLLIDVKPSGAESADLDLPASFKGRLHIGTISGAIDLGEKIELSEIKLDTASGDVSLAAWPTSKLEINTVSGDIRSADGVSGSPKTIVLQSVSGDFDVNFPNPFETLNAHTVSGAVHLRIPDSLDYSYDLHSVSGEFNGLPKGGTLNEGFGNKEMKGSTSNAVKARIIFDSVSGDFELASGEAVGSR